METLQESAQISNQQQSPNINPQISKPSFTSSNQNSHTQIASNASDTTSQSVDNPTVDTTESTLSQTEISPLLKEQLKFCSNVLRSLKRHKDSSPFFQPVDPVALQIPDYLEVIKHPMDFGTIGTKLSNHQYHNVEEFNNDVKLVFSNCYTYNKPETIVNNMGKNLEKVYDNLMRKLPTQLAPKKVPTEPQTPVDEPGRPRRSSIKRRSESPTFNDSKQSRYRDMKKRKPTPQIEDLKFCNTILRELTRKQNLSVVWPFLQPVDPITLGIPDYYNVIKHPMDISLIRHKMESKQYNAAEEFESDFRLMCNNCYVYNAPDSDVVNLCRALENQFNEKWNSRPSRTRTFSQTPSPKSKSRHRESFLDDEEIDVRVIALTKQVQAIQSEIADLLALKTGKKNNIGRSGSPSTKKGQRKKKDEMRSMTFEEKRQLSLDINDLPPEKLGKVVEIIHTSMPQLRDSTDSDEIELDIDSLDLKALHALSKYVKQCKKVKMNGSKITGTTIDRSMGGSSSSDESSGDE